MVLLVMQWYILWSMLFHIFKKKLNLKAFGSNNLQILTFVKTINILLSGK